MSQPHAVRDAEAIALDLTRQLTHPADAECLYCFVHRMLDEHGCDNTVSWAARYRDTLAPGDAALERRLSQAGGFCDCEVFLNVVTLADSLLVVGDELADPGELDADPQWPDPLPPCAGAPAGSTRGCANWTSPRR